MVDKRKREIRARMAETGENYARAARELDKLQRRGVVAGFEDLADPTTSTVHAAVALLVNRLMVLRSEAASRDCTDPAAFGRAVGGASALAMDLEDQLADGNEVNEAAVDRAKGIAGYLATAGELTVRSLGVRVGAATAEAHAVARALGAVREGVCTLGAGSKLQCGSDPSRIRLRLYDSHGGAGHHDTEQGCVTHAVDEWGRRVRHARVRVEVIGPPSASASFHSAIAPGEERRFVDDVDGWAELDDHFRLVLAQHDAFCVVEAMHDAYASGHDDESTVHQVAAQFLEGHESSCRCGTALHHVT